MKQILLISQGIVHPPVFARQVLRKLIQGHGGYVVEEIQSPEDFPKELDRFDAMALYYHLERISDRALAEFEQYVSMGGGVLALHSATASFKDSPKYFRILGGQFKEHDVVTEFPIEPTDRNSIFNDLSPFSVVDELYIHDTEPDIQVQLKTNFEGQQIPVAWTHRYGQGRILYASPGHRTATMRNPQYQALILSGLEWVCDNE